MADGGWSRRHKLFRDDLAADEEKAGPVEQQDAGVVPVALTGADPQAANVVVPGGVVNVGAGGESKREEVGPPTESKAAPATPTTDATDATGVVSNLSRVGGTKSVYIMKTKQGKLVDLGPNLEKAAKAAGFSSAHMLRKALGGTSGAKLPENSFADMAGGGQIARVHPTNSKALMASHSGLFSPSRMMPHAPKLGTPAATSAKLATSEKTIRFLRAEIARLTPSKAKRTL